MRSTRSPLVALVTLLAACGAPQDPATEDLTVSEHQREAQREEREAAEHLERSDAYYDVDSYDPGHGELTQAEAHLEHAEAHRRRAAELQAFEEAECSRFPPASREACPFLLGVTSVEDIEGGSRVGFDSDAPVDAIADHIRCHLAFVQAHGAGDLDACALYVPGASVLLQGTFIFLTTDQPEHVAALRERVAYVADH